MVPQLRGVHSYFQVFVTFRPLIHRNIEMTVKLDIEVLLFPVDFNSASEVVICAILNYLWPISL